MTDHLVEHHTIIEAILLEIAGKSGIAGIALWKYHGMPNCNWKHVMEIWSTNSWIASIKKGKSIYKLHGGSHQPFNIINIIQYYTIFSSYQTTSNLKTSELANLVLGSHLFSQWESQNHIKRLQWLQNTDNWTLTYLTAPCLQKEGRICSSHWFDGEELVIVGLQWVEHTHSLVGCCSNWMVVPKHPKELTLWMSLER